MNQASLMKGRALRLRGKLLQVSEFYGSLCKRGQKKQLVR